MFSKWLKPYLPRSLFGRAILILLVPVVLIQLVVGIIFVERLFLDVSRQMTKSAARDVTFVIKALHQEEIRPAMLSNLAIAWSVQDVTPPSQDQRYWSDFSGQYVIETLRSNIEGVIAVDLRTDKSLVKTYVMFDGAPAEFTFSRRRASATNPHQLLVAMVLAAMLLTLLAAVFLHNQIQPIRRLARAAEAFGKGQTLKLSPRGASEVRSAAHAFLSMRKRIDRQIEQRTLMLSGVSHDLRTPLTRLKLSAAMLDDSEETALMLKDVTEMQEILDEFLAFARGDSGETAELVQPKAFATQLVENFNRSHPQVDLVFLGEPSNDKPVSMRQLAIQRALSNLLSNAIKYGSKVRLCVNLGKTSVDFVVEDNGEGIGEDQREDAVKPFNRLDSARNQDKGSGVGLGLAIAADIARSHGGSMELGESADLGGLRVSFRIPR